MLTLKLGRAFDLLTQLEIDPLVAMEEFYQGVDLSHTQLSDELLQGLFGEWLLFEYRVREDKTLIELYAQLDPHRLSRQERRELEAIIETNQLHLLQPCAPAQAPYVFLQSVFTGQKFKVHDHALSQSIDNLPGSFYGRISRVLRCYYLVGSNPIGLPIRHTPRTIEMFAQEPPPNLTLKELLAQLSQPTPPAPKIDLRRERARLKREYTQLAQEYNSPVTFQLLIEFIREEDYQNNVADWMTDLIKLGIPEEMLISHMEVFQNIWNYFPHDVLGGKAPHQLFKRNRR